MGLLDDLMSQLASGTPASDPRPARTQASAGSGGTAVLAALLPVVLAMLRGGGQPQAGPGPSTGGGLGDVLGRMLGGAGGGSGGGLGALLEQFQHAGFGEQARSWVGTGQNMPMPADALEQVFGRGGLAEIARRAGLSEQDTSQGLSQLMPEVIDHVTPSGQAPGGDSLLASVDALAKRLGAG